MNVSRCHCEVAPLEVFEHTYYYEGNYRPLAAGWVVGASEQPTGI